MKGLLSCSMHALTDPLFSTTASSSTSVAGLECTVNGLPGLVAQRDGVTVTVVSFEHVLSFEVLGDRIERIRRIRAVLIPDKLRSWPLPWQNPPSK